MAEGLPADERVWAEGGGVGEVGGYERTCRCWTDFAGRM